MSITSRTNTNHDLHFLKYTRKQVTFDTSFFCCCTFKDKTMRLTWFDRSRNKKKTNSVQEELKQHPVAGICDQRHVALLFFCQRCQVYWKENVTPKSPRRLSFGNVKTNTWQTKLQAVAGRTEVIAELSVFCTWKQLHTAEVYFLPVVLHLQLSACLNVGVRALWHWFCCTNCRIPVSHTENRWTLVLWVMHFKWEGATPPFPAASLTPGWLINREMLLPCWGTVAHNVVFWRFIAWKPGDTPWIRRGVQRFAKRGRFGEVKLYESQTLYWL